MWTKSLYSAILAQALRLVIGLYSSDSVGGEVQVGGSWLQLQRVEKSGEKRSQNV